ncbi:VOC family protein [Vibrio sp. T187]|uniref:VOC family protein n=1 Tax=Vibrio TaxID=662 RepID=UPI0010C9B397|nr:MULTISPECIES: VOC family protein [Vibrio]MBW3695333.1 VOC family protein [Vibrio sp. T187]
MIGYLILGSNNIQASNAFYSPLLAMMEAKQVVNSDSFLAWSFGEGTPVFSIRKPADGNEASNGNGTLVALRASSTEMVDRLHQKALSLGGQNEGDPGVRSGGFYCAYFRDPDGNKLNFHCKP